jgi:polyphosphate glucokinase
MSEFLGIDVGGSGIKAAVVDVETGNIVSERVRLATPSPATPQAIAKVVKQLPKALKWAKGPVGCGFPAIVKDGVARSAANIDPKWVGTNIETLLGDALQAPVHALNDADAAGMAAMQYGLGKGVSGTVLFITIGSGLGSALFHNGILVPNTEFGHLILEGKIAEHYASNNVRKSEELSWEEFGHRLGVYIRHLERLISPDLILLGGGVSKHYEKYEAYIGLGTPVRSAMLGNNAGIIGAALHASSTHK